MSDERDAKVAEFNGWMQDDNDIRDMGYGVFKARNVRSAQHLAAELPEVFDELHEMAADLLKQSPTVKGPVWEH